MHDYADISGHRKTRQRGRVRQVLPGAPRADTPREFSFVMIWDSLDSLKAFVGDDYQSPHIDPAEAELVEARTIKHYELVET